MNDELLARIEREVLGWDGVFKKRDEHGPGGIGVTALQVRRSREEDPRSGTSTTTATPTSVPREVRDELIRTGRAIPHPAFPDSRRRRVTGSKARKMWQEPWSCSHELRT